MSQATDRSPSPTRAALPDVRRARGELDPPPALSTATAAAGPCGRKTPTAVPRWGRDSDPPLGPPGLAGRAGHRYRRPRGGELSTTYASLDAAASKAALRRRVRAGEPGASAAIGGERPRGARGGAGRRMTRRRGRTRAAAGRSTGGRGAAPDCGSPRAGRASGRCARRSACVAPATRGGGRRRSRSRARRPGRRRRAGCRSRPGGTGGSRASRTGSRTAAGCGPAAARRSHRGCGPPRCDYPTATGRARSPRRCATSPPSRSKPSDSRPRGKLPTLERP
jgi:hypothetical protein